MMIFSTFDRFWFFDTQSMLIDLWFQSQSFIIFRHQIVDIVVNNCTILIFVMVDSDFCNTWTRLMLSDRSYLIFDSLSILIFWYPIDVDFPDAWSILIFWRSIDADRWLVTLLFLIFRLSIYADFVATQSTLILIFLTLYRCWFVQTRRLLIFRHSIIAVFLTLNCSWLFDTWSMLIFRHSIVIDLLTFNRFFQLMFDNYFYVNRLDIERRSMLIFLVVRSMLIFATLNRCRFLSTW